MGEFLKYFSKLNIFISIIFFNHRVHSEVPEKHFGSCVAGSYGMGHFVHLEDCPLFRSVALQSYKANFYLGQTIYCCPDAGIYYDDLLPHAPLCGTMLAKRIVGGTSTSIDEFPWTARLKYLKKRQTLFLCGGSLISSRWVLTAAHCVIGYDLRDARVIGVRLGDWHTATNPDCEIDARGYSDCAPPHIDVNIDRIVPHQDFDKLRRFADDIALLRLAEFVDFTDFIKPICLPIEPSLRNGDLLHMAVDVTGWGRSAGVNGSQSLIKQKATLKVLPLDDCQRTYAPWHLKVNEKQLCAGGEAGVDTCRGDSGGPLMLEMQNERSMAFFHIAGVVSFGKMQCGRKSQPAVYTRVGAYINWIINKIRENS